jgi:hypothetical protein
MSVSMRQSRSGGLRVIIRTRSAGGKMMRLRIRSPFLGRAETMRWARRHEMAFQKASSAPEKTWANREDLSRQQRKAG